MIRWRYTTGDGESASWALASDELLMARYARWAEGGFSEPTLRIYTFRSHCALVGRFQNTEAEVNLPECRALNVEVRRRMTGGGAVLMGERQLMIALTSSAEHPVIPSHPARALPKLARGVIAGLEELGIAAEYRPKNDIVVNGRKIGGTAIAIEETGAFLFHATVLLDFDVPLMLRVLNIPAEKISDKGISSHKERLTTARRELGCDVDVQEAREAVCRGFERVFRITAVHTPFSSTEIEGIGKLEREKYLTDAWLYQRQPEPDMLGTSIRKTPAGLVRAYVALIGDTIKSVLITGDFITGNRVVNDIEAVLKWGRSDRESIARAVRVAMSSSGASLHGTDPDELAGIIHDAVTHAHSVQGAGD
jgi:lipoate-protein ligase A